MNENVRIAVDAILANKMRAGLTMLGIIIGIASVIALISLGRGVEVFIFNEFELLGAKRLSVSSSPPVSESRTRIDPITMDDVSNLRDPQIAPSVLETGATYNVVVLAEYMGESVATTARGYTPNMSDMLSWDVLRGRFFTEEENAEKEKVALLGLDVVNDLFGDERYNPVGAFVRLGDQSFEVIGVMDSRGSALGNDNSAIIVPISVAQTRLGNARVGNEIEVNTIYVEARTNDLIDRAEEEIDQYLYTKHLLNSADERDYEISNPSTIQEAVRGITGLLTTLLGLIASISLVVGGIGIMNIMLVTVTERTREIGLRKAVGATPDRILGQFLIESIILSLLGGIIGIILGWLVALLGTTLIDGLYLTVDIDAIVIATTVSTGVGIIFGIWPARQAARMNPIDALRYE